MHRNHRSQINFVRVSDHVAGFLFSSAPFVAIVIKSPKLFFTFSDTKTLAFLLGAHPTLLVRNRH